MKGLELAQKYWEEVGRPAFEKECPQVLERAAVGLVGEGSECFGFDDQYSRDHDWGPGFCVWLTDEDYKGFGEKAAAVYASLPEEFMGFKRLNAGEMSSGRVGVMSSGSFYARYTGFDRVPQSIFEWRCAPEKGLAVVTNGRLFEDRCEEFRAVRDGLLAYYPEDLRKKKLAMRCALAAQAGQYNFSRCARRGEDVAAFLALAEFVDNVQAIVFLLNKRYRPFYKWSHRAMKELPVLGSRLAPQIETLTSGVVPEDGLAAQGTQEELSGQQGAQPRLLDVFEKVDLIESISQCVIAELKAEGLSQADSDFLLHHGEAIQYTIADPQLRSMHLMAE